MAEEPARDVAIDLCIKAWLELDTTRQVGFAGAGSIPWDKIVAWCEFHAHELDHEAAVQLCDVIRQLDIDRARREASRRAIENATK